MKNSPKKALIIHRESVLCADGTPALCSISEEILRTKNDAGFAVNLGFFEAHGENADDNSVDDSANNSVDKSHTNTNQTAASCGALDDCDVFDGISANHLYVISLDYALSCGVIGQHGDVFLSSEYKSLQLVEYRNLVSHHSRHANELISRAIQLSLWQADHRFCSRCAAPTRKHHFEHAMVCPRCRHRAYPRVQPCIIVAITRTHPTGGQPQILLALHQRHTATGMYGLVAGFVEAGESLESAVRREVLEEVGLTIDEPRYIGSQPWPYPTNIMLGFTANWAGGEICVQPNEITDAKFFDLDKLPRIPAVGTIAHELIVNVLSAHGVDLADNQPVSQTD